jgi:hypothetical protein
MPQSSRTLQSITWVVGYLVGYAAVRILGINTNIRLLTGTLVGLLLTLPPYFIARRKGLSVLGKNFLLAGAGVGAIGGALLALPLTIVLTVVALRKRPSPAPAAVCSPGGHR